MVRWPQIIPAEGTLRIVPSHVGVFSEHATQTFTAYDGATQLDVADVDWWIGESPTDGQGLSPEEIATIDQNGVATILGAISLNVGRFRRSFPFFSPGTMELFS